MSAAPPRACSSFVARPDAHSIEVLAITPCSPPDPGTIGALRVPDLPAEGHPAFLADVPILIPNLAHGQTYYNGGMARFRNKTLAALRVDDAHTHGEKTTQHIAIIELDKRWRPATPLTWLKSAPAAGVPCTDEDPRLVVVDDVLFVIYNRAHGAARRIHVAQIEVGEDDAGITTFRLHHDKRLEFRESAADGWEKNWTPFAYKSILHLIYTTNPPLVLRVTPQQLASADAQVVPEVVSRANETIWWNFGGMRGGTQALFDRKLQRYVSFFHSSAPATGPQGLMRYYVMGFYTFAPQPPFSIDRIIRAPLVGAGFYDEAANLAPHPVSVIFPQGLVDEDNDDSWQVMYGKGDRALRVASLSKTMLRDELMPPELVTSSTDGSVDRGKDPWI